MKARGIRVSEWFTSTDEFIVRGPHLHRFVNNSGLSVCGKGYYGISSMTYSDYAKFINHPTISEHRGNPNVDDYMCDECREYMCDCGSPLKDNERECWRCRHSVTRGKIWFILSIAGVVGAIVSVISGFF
ncbi:MAG: hypothetical protein MPL62_14535 [Alphaproteobacteria bacterium]|nr:hypothetical protein [Alphaproteobacteria bacterium]